MAHVTAPATSTTDPLPEMLPLLARGRHRNPRRGACFMELASYLAGERWSDSPRCTDPALAALARMVNDVTSDDARPLLATLVPDVVGTAGRPATFAGDLALLAVAHSIGVVAHSHQQSLAVGTLRLLADERATTDGPLRRRALAALAEIPSARDWAEDFLARVRPHADHPPTPGLLEVAVLSLATACVDDADTRLRALLTEAVEMARTGPSRTLQPAEWVGRVRAAV